ncbi:hypothetical protein Y1Q_0005907 [Alligator mississippiensis]|uniref:Zinc finger protein RFP-like n=1 Tax=Alligator mississippiensis TaxID=8496 RepID=A0A151MXM5_ALLMI|nr:hypothetical protein Y1Q_0005907 [Alligator mississippiensis]
MAAQNPIGNLQDEATCPICLEYFTQPVTLECGHNFCRDCITQCWNRLQPKCFCPQCRQDVQQKNLRPNRQLENILKIAKQLTVQAVKGAGGKEVCQEHQEPLKLFCEEDQTPICVVCDRSRSHRAHAVVPIEEAAKEYKDKIQTHLKTLKQDQEKLKKCKLTGEKSIGEYLRKTEAEQKMIISQFQQLHQFLQEKEQLLLAQLRELNKEIVTLQNKNITKLAQRISQLHDLIHEMEGKCQQPVSEFLQGVRSTLSRYEKGKFQHMVEIPSELEKRLKDFSHKNVILTETLRKFKDTLHSELEIKNHRLLGLQRHGEITGSLPPGLGKRRRRPPQPYTKANVTLDPDTAYPKLIVSINQKSVKHQEEKQTLPDNPQRFDTVPCVLGHEGFTSGRHWWEVEVVEGRYWAVGVARASVRRKGGINLSTDKGIWAVECIGTMEYIVARTSPWTRLSLNRNLRTIRISLDYDSGQVAFFDVENNRRIFTFPPASFTEDLTPICMVCDRSKEHSFHTVVPIEEAAQDYKKNIQVYLVILNKKREKLLNFKASEAKRVREHLKQTEAERQKIVSEFEQLHQFLKDQEQLLLARLGELEREFVKSQEEKSSEVSKGISVLNKVIADLEEKCQQPASDFLQDIRRILNRCEKMKEFCKPEGISPELEQRLLHFSRKNIAVKVALKKFKDALLSELKTEREKSRGGDGQVNVTLDPETASPQLILSVDRKSVTWGVTRLSHPENPQRFDAAPCVLGSMADLNPLERLQEEATCSICLVFFNDPVSLDCGHNFCRACIAQCWEGVGTDHDSVSCPQCRETFQQRNLRTNRQLANFVEIAKQLSVQTAGGTEGEAKCKEHGEIFKLFCKDDEAFICVICRESRDHRTHKVFPVGEAAEEYKEYLQTQMMTLKEKREDLMKYKLDGEKESLKWLEKTEAERQKIVLEFQKLRQFLEEQEQLLLTQLAKLEKEIVQRQGDSVTNLSKNISQLDNLICEIEGKYQQPVNEFLKDIKSTLSRCKTVHFKKPVFMPRDLTVQLSRSSQTNIYLQEALTKFKETLPFELRKGIRCFPSQSLSPPTSNEACRAANQQPREDICRGMTERDIKTGMKEDLTGNEDLIISCASLARGVWSPLHSIYVSVWVEKELQVELSFCDLSGRRRNGFCDTGQGRAQQACPFYTALCLVLAAVCHVSRAHRDHRMVPVEEAVQEYKEKIETQLVILRKERLKLQKFIVKKENVHQKYLNHVQAKRQKITNEFKELHQFLEEQEQILLALVRVVEEEIVKEQKDFVTRLLEEIAGLSELISKIEEKCQQPSSEFLQDIRDTLSRYENVKFQKAEFFSIDLQKKIHNFAETCKTLEDTTMKFKDHLLEEMGKNRVDVILDPATAHSNLTCLKIREVWNTNRQNKLSLTILRDSVLLCVCWALKGFWQGNITGRLAQCPCLTKHILWSPWRRLPWITRSAPERAGWCVAFITRKRSLLRLEMGWCLSPQQNAGVIYSTGPNSK